MLDVWELNRNPIIIDPVCIWRLVVQIPSLGILALFHFTETTEKKSIMSQKYFWDKTSKWPNLGQQCRTFSSWGMSSENCFCWWIRQSGLVWLICQSHTVDKGPNLWERIWLEHRACSNVSLSVSDNKHSLTSMLKLWMLQNMTFFHVLEWERIWRFLARHYC